jgi:hypothetical protein
MVTFSLWKEGVRWVQRREQGRSRKAARLLDDEIAKIYYETCSRIVIPLFDIPKIYAAARKARAEGLDMRAAIMAFVDSIAVSRDAGARASGATS